MNEIFNHLWQSTLFAGAVVLVTAGLRRNSPRLRYWLWLAASVKFLIPFSSFVSTGARIQLPRNAPSLHAVTVQQITTYFAPVSVFPAAAPAHVTFPWPLLLSVTWLTGVIFLLGRWFWRWRSIYLAARRAKRLPLRLPIPAFSSPVMMEPGVFGLFRPVLLLPEGLTDRLAPEQFEAILAHELRHIQYRDNISAALHMCVETIFWFDPVVWWIGAMLIVERERDCDETVLRRGTQPGEYARGIVQVCQTYIESALPCAPGISGSDLKKRIREIMTWRGSIPVTFAGKALLIAAGLAAISGPLVIGIIRAQTFATAKFEVVSLRPSLPVRPGDRVYFGPPRGGPGTPDPGEITWSYALMKTLIVTAYDVKAYQVSGPPWLDTERFDIVAKVPAGATKEQVAMMWQNLLAERFGLRVHHESREFQVENLVIVEGGPKLRETEDPNAPLPPNGPELKNGALQTPGMVHTLIPLANGVAKGHTVAKAQPLSQLTTMLGNAIHRPVIDKTGLTGKYDFSIDFTLDFPNPPAVGQGAGPGAAVGNTGGEQSPELATAVQQQLGLRLVADKANLDVVIIDAAERVPTGN